MGVGEVLGSDKEIILEAIREKTLWSGGHGCYTAPALANDCKMPLSKVKAILNELYKEKLIKVSPTIHGLGARSR